MDYCQSRSVNSHPERRERIVGPPVKIDWMVVCNLLSRNGKMLDVGSRQHSNIVRVAQFESITRAARSLGMLISTVSRRSSVMESELGVSLLRRTTRRVTLTAQGRSTSASARSR